ncbi:MAG: DUF47 family protein [Clostridia bacterium]|nr:DUF47 family protein [Clostridia bacterium]MBQ7046896.1 DUF47 family protein [Oscillospiraceae bacterium]
MAKGDKFYFENFAESTALSKKAAAYLVECLENYNAEDIEKMLEEMHKIEHSADIKKHEMSEALAKAFVTPVDREDLDMLSNNLDQVTDKIEEILQKFYIYNIQSVDSSVIEFAKKIVKSCEILCELMNEFENFKRSKKIRKLIIELNDVEEECDRLYLSSMRALTNNPADALTIVSFRKIYDCFESCADACEHVGECVRTVIMKNT